MFNIELHLELIWNFAHHILHECNNALLATFLYLQIVLQTYFLLIVNYCNLSAPLVNAIKIWTFYDIQAAVFSQSYVIVLDGSLTVKKAKKYVKFLVEKWSLSKEFLKQCLTEKQNSCL